MELLLKLMLVLHIASGFLSLLTGLVALVVKKGGRTHRLSGKVFFYGMCGVAFSGLVLGWAKANYFLFMIAIFSFFMNYSGYRSTLNKSLKPNIPDWAILCIGLVNSLFMLYSANIVLMVFGGIGAALALGDIRIFVLTLRGKDIGRLQWLFRHIGMMVGAYIATVTAFVVVNVHDVRPVWLPWLLPTVLLVPVIIYYNIKYRRKVVK